MSSFLRLSLDYELEEYGLQGLRPKAGVNDKFLSLPPSGGIAFLQPPTFILCIELQGPESWIEGPFYLKKTETKVGIHS